MALTDGELAAQMAAGDEMAFACLVDRHKDRMVAYLTRMVGVQQTAEDLAQEAFLKLFSQVERLRADGNVLAYLYRIATNLARSELRRRARKRALAELFPWVPGQDRDPRADAEIHLENLELKHEVERALAELPLKYRAAVIMHDLQGVAYADIAKALGASDGTVKSRIFRGRQLLKKALLPYVKGDGHGRPRARQTVG